MSQPPPPPTTTSTPPAVSRAAVSAPGHEAAGNPRRSAPPRRPSSWEDLPSELLGLVLLHLPSLADRARFRAVCGSWRAAARLQRLPPPFPWFALRDGTLVDHGGNPIRCAPFLRETDLGYLSVDNLALVVHDDDGECSLVNPISGSVTPLPKLAEAVRLAIKESDYFTMDHIRKAYVKVVLSSLLDSSPDPFIAAAILEANAVAVSTCKRHEATSISFYPELTQENFLLHVDDIAFSCGKLYTLSEKEALHHIQLDAGYSGFLNVPEASLCFHMCIAKDPEQEVFCDNDTDGRYFVLRYLVQSRGSLFMVRRWMKVLPLEMLRTCRFELFKADLTTVPGHWENVDSLGGDAVFLSSECSKSVCPSKCTGGVQEDCIYFMHRLYDDPSMEDFDPSLDPLRDSGVYNMKDRIITPLLPEAVMEKLRRKRMFLTWFFPADV